MISGNLGGVAVHSGGATANLVQGNYIGTDVTGTVAVGNKFFGVRLFAPGNTIGGTAPGARNIISGNDERGVIILFEGGNEVQGNFIGTDASGTAPLGNGFQGVYIGGPNNLVGGADPAAANVIAANLDGVQLVANAATGNHVAGNFIGTNADGDALGNSRFGVVIQDASGNKIGGAVGAGNAIAFNGGDGVVVLSTAAVNNALRGNAIFSNVGLGINLVNVGPDGVTPNDPGDGDTGANQLQNFPVLTSAVSAGGTTVVEGTLNSTPLTTFALDFFSNSACDPSGFGEGERFLGSTAVTTDATGNANFVATLPAPTASGDAVTATATDPTGNTSEFAQCITSGGADLSITKTDSPDPVMVNNNLTYTVSVHNNGPSGASSVTVVDALPAGVTFVSATASQGNCTEAAGTVTCDLGNMAGGAGATVEIVVKPTAPGTITDTATVTANETDPNPADNTATETTTVQSPETAIGDLISAIEALGDVNQGERNSLTTKLDAALRSLGRGSTNAACGQFGAFANEVDAMVRSRRLDPATGGALVSAVGVVTTALGC